jgi:hypothetical protein
MARRIPHASLAELPDAGHKLLIDEPERCGPAITRFLDGGAEAPPACTARAAGGRMAPRPPR